MKLKMLIPTLVLLAAVSHSHAQNTSNVIVPGNPATPFGFVTASGGIRNAILKAGPLGVVWIPANYTDSDCNPLSGCQPGTTLIIDLRGGTFTTYPALSGGGGSGVTITTVAGLPSVSGKTNGTIAIVTNGASATDCTTGGGSTVVNCQFNGSSWSQVVAASSGSTAFSALTGGTNTAAAMVLGTGSSLTVSGSGTNNASTLGGSTFANPGPIGSGTASTGAFTTLSASSTVSGSGFSTYLASPPAIGGSSAAAGSFTTLSASSTVSG